MKETCTEVDIETHIETHIGIYIPGDVGDKSDKAICDDTGDEMALFSLY
jgi:hypothetical protein